MRQATNVLDRVTDAPGDLVSLEMSANVCALHFISFSFPKLPVRLLNATYDLGVRGMRSEIPLYESIDPGRFQAPIQSALRPRSYLPQGKPAKGFWLWLTQLYYAIHQMIM